MPQLVVGGDDLGGLTCFSVNVRFGWLDQTGLLGASWWWPPTGSTHCARPGPSALPDEGTHTILSAHFVASGRRECSVEPLGKDDSRSQLSGSSREDSMVMTHLCLSISRPRRSPVELRRQAVKRDCDILQGKENRMVSVRHESRPR